MKRVFFIFLLAIVLPVSFVEAGEYAVRPFLMDHTVTQRDVVQDTVKLTNDSTYRKYVVYATVNEISADTNGEIKDFISPVMTDRTNTVTSWIEVTRGRIEIPPESEKEIPITFRINPSAQPGVYHAFIGFVPAPNRPKAEEIAMNGEADGVVVKITVADERDDSMKIAGFFINRFITGDTNKEIDIVVENLGDITSAPSGELVFYDSRGVEIEAVPVNTEKRQVLPGETITFKSTVPVEDSLGRFKANLSLQYGDNQGASLYDTTYFYMMPWNLLLIIFGIILIGTILVTLLFKKTFMSDQFTGEEDDQVTMYVREGHDPNPQDHDIDLKNKPHQ